MIKLNNDQEAAAHDIKDFIDGKLDIPYFTLTGGPGTGKTFMLKEALRRTHSFLFDRSAATVSHAAKNVISEAFNHSIPCYTVAQWLGMKMVYYETGEIAFKPDKYTVPKLVSSRVAILDEASMINDDLYNEIMKLVINHRLKLIVVGDIHQLPPVKQDHDSKFFERIDAELTIPMRFLGPIADVTKVYRDAIDDINSGYGSTAYVLNEKTNREDRFDASLNSGYYFQNNIYELIDQVAHEIKDNPKDLNFSRVLAYKNATIDILNKNIRMNIYGDNLNQFEKGEIVISKGGFAANKMPVIHNGKLLKVKDFREVIGPYDIPCLSMEFHDLHTTANIVTVKEDKSSLERYYSMKNRLAEKARFDPKQWIHYYNFMDSFAYFDYAYSVNTYKAQGQTLKNVYVIENEIMGVKPLTLKQKYQALYVAMTRASKNLYIYNRDY